MRALVVDDSRIMRLMVRKQLVGCGLEDDCIDEAGDGREALDRMESEPVDLILSDVNMPVMDGENLLYQLASREFFGRGRMVMVTSRYERGLFKRLLHNGASAIIRKPFNATSFRRQLEPVLQDLADGRPGYVPLSPMVEDEAEVAAGGLDPVTIILDEPPHHSLAKATVQVLQALELRAGLWEHPDPPDVALVYADIPILGHPRRTMTLYADADAVDAFSRHTTGLAVEDDEARADVLGEIANIVVGHWLPTARPPGATGFGVPETGRMDPADLLHQDLGGVRVGPGGIWAWVG